MQMPYHSSTTALFDSSERLNRTSDPYDRLYNGGIDRKSPLDETQDWDGYMKAHSRDRDSGLVTEKCF